MARLCCWCGVVTGLLSQTAVHFAENHRRWPDLGEVDCSLSKVGCTCSRAALFRACVGPWARMNIDGLRQYGPPSFIPPCRVGIRPSWAGWLCVLGEFPCERRLMVLSDKPMCASNGDLYDAGIVVEVAMRTTVTLDDDLLARAEELTGVKERSALIREAVELLVRIESGRQLAALGGSDSAAEAAPRSRERA